MPFLPEGISSYAGEIDGLFVFITVIVGVWFVAAELVLLYLALRFRRRPGRRAAYLPANTLRSMSVVLIPCAIVLALDLVIDVEAHSAWVEVKETLPPHDVLVRVTGQQWAWTFTYPGPDGQLDTPDDVQLVNELHVPVGKVVLFELTSKDVLHSFWVPQLRLKQDAVPGRTIRGWFRADREGRFDVACAEICGFAHTMMKGTLVVQSPDAYRDWLASQSRS